MPTKGGYVDPDFPNPMGPDDASIIIYGYTPSVALGGLAIATWTPTMVIHIWRTVSTRAWYTIPLPVACFMELLGYIFRLLSGKQDPYRVAFFVAQYFLIVTAPILITASMYVCLTRILRVLDGHQIARPALISKFGPRSILWIFVVADVLTTIIQVAGAALIGVRTSNGDDPASANNIVLAGIAIQLFFFLSYLILLTSAALRIRVATQLPKAVRRFVLVLGLASFLVVIRLVFRLAETGEGVFSTASSLESLFGVLEYVPILGALVLLAIWHPGLALLTEYEKRGASFEMGEKAVDNNDS